RRDDGRIRIELIKGDQPHAAIIERHLAEPTIIGERIAPAAARRQQQSPDQSSFHIIRRQHPRHVFSFWPSARLFPVTIVGWVRSCRGTSRTSSRSPWLQ